MSGRVARRFLSAVGAVVVSAGLSVGAHATAFCDVRKTADGFVALRAEPSASGKLILRLKAGEQVQLDSTIAKRKGWVHVHYWHDGAIRHSGWASRGLIERECG